MYSISTLGFLQTINQVKAITKPDQVVMIGEVFNKKRACLKSPSLLLFFKHKNPPLDH
jgi:hypothetical protein